MVMPRRGTIDHKYLFFLHIVRFAVFVAKYTCYDILFALMCMLPPGWIEA